jgi:hypothetical protein
MIKIIDIRIPTEYFGKDRNNALEARLAKFELAKGDVLRFHEWDVKTKRYTGKYYDREVKDFHRIRKATRFWKKSDLLKYGIYIFSLTEPKKKHGKRKLVKPVNVL